MLYVVDITTERTGQPPQHSASPLAAGWYCIVAAGWTMPPSVGWAYRHEPVRPRRTSCRAWSPLWVPIFGGQPRLDDALDTDGCQVEQPKAILEPILGGSGLDDRHCVGHRLDVAFEQVDYASLLIHATPPSPKRCCGNRSRCGP